MEITKELYPAIATVAAALIAASISFLSLVLSKENKISELRHAWIDALRDDIAEFCSLTASMYSHLVHKQITDPSAFLMLMDEKYPDVVKINKHATRIALRLNPDEHSKLLDLLKEIEGENGKQLMFDASRRLPFLQQVEIESQIVLKTEWAKVKRGESLFVAAKRLTLGVTIFGLLVFFAYVVKGLWFWLAS